MEGVACKTGRRCYQAGFDSSLALRAPNQAVPLEEEKNIIRMIEQRMEQGHALRDVFANLNATGKSLDCLRKDLKKVVNIFQNV